MTRRTSVLVLSLALLAAPAWGDDPPKPDAPQAVATARPSDPSGSTVYVDASGSKSASPVQFKVIGRPAEPRVFAEGHAGALFPALPDGHYFVAVIATAPKDFAGDPVDVAVVEFQVGPLPTPTPKPTDPRPVDPTDPPVPKPTTGDTLGLASFTRQTLAATGWTADQARPGATTLAAIFSSQAAAAGTYASPQAFTDATGKACKAALGDAGWATWSRFFLGPLTDRMADLNAKGKIRTVADLAEAFTEVAGALREFAP